MENEHIALGVCLALAALVLLSAIRRALRSRTARVRSQRAIAGERRAGKLLLDRGYAIVAAQVSTVYEVTLDGAAVAVRLRADYLVERGGARFVAEVKTGNLAPRIETPATRRQLLEYGIAFDVDGVLLVDAEAGLVQEVVFPQRAPRRGGGGGWLAFAAALAGIAYLLIAAR